MWRSVVVAGAFIIGCGGGHTGSALDAGSGSDAPSGPGNYQTAQGFCAGNTTLSGGDLVGTWTIVGACAISTGAPANCADTTLTLSLAARGTVTFNADLTGSIDVTVDLKKTSSVALSCSSAGDCPSLQSTLAFEVGADAGTSATCAPSGTDVARCACAEDYGSVLLQGSGSYRFTLPNYLESSGTLGLQGGFLVAGNTLRLDGLGFRGTEFDLIAER